MKRVLMFVLMLSVLLLVACSSQPDATTSNESAETGAPSSPVHSEEPTTTMQQPETEPSFDLDAYKEEVGQFRSHVMENSLLLYNVGNYEVNYLKALGSTSDSTVEKGFDWLSSKTDSTRESVDAAHQVIRDEYAALILFEVEGKEAEALDGYVRSMYEGYAALYDCVTSNSFTSSQLTSKINDAIGLINGADSDMGLFLD